MRLRPKLLLLALPLTLAPLLVLGWIAYDQLKENAERSLLTQTQTVVDQLEREFIARVNNAKANTTLLAENHLLQKYVLTADSEERYGLMQRPLLRVLRAYQHAYPTHYDVRVLLADGAEDLRSTNATDAQETAPDALGALLRDSATSSDGAVWAPQRHPLTGETRIAVLRRLVLRDPAVQSIGAPPQHRGYLLMMVRLDSLTEQVKNAQIGVQGALLVANARGEVLLHTPDRGALVRSGLAKGETHLVSSPAFAPMRSAAAARKLVSVELGGSLNRVRGVRLHDDLYLFAYLPESEMTASSRQISGAVIFIGGATLLMTTFTLLASLTYLVLRPLGRLQRAADMIGEGTLDVRIVKVSNDEIGQLSDSFNAMSQSLTQSDEKIRYLAYHDNLTGLPNRHMFEEFMAQAMARAQRRGEKLALLFLDLDNFKRVNDTLGHQPGDLLLQQFARRLRDILREGDYVARADMDINDDLIARLGGDEFILLLPYIRDPYEAGNVAQRILDTLAEPFKIEGHDLFIGVSLGVAIFPGDGATPEELIRNADVAMYHAKLSGKNDYRFFDSEMNAATARRLSMEKRLRRALDHGDFRLIYQPQFHVRSGTIVGVEALLRWLDAELQSVPTREFVELAEETGLITQIGQWVLTHACQQAHTWHEAGLAPVRMAVNASAVQLTRRRLFDQIEHALTESGLAPQYLDIELTERAFVALGDERADMLNRFEELGVGLSLDDFGAGYSSIEHLRTLNLDRLKIDVSLIAGLPKDPRECAIVSALIGVGHALGVDVVAEGVENEAQKSFLMSAGCDFAQGFLFCAPLRAEDMAKLLAPPRALG